MDFVENREEENCTSSSSDCCEDAEEKESRRSVDSEKTEKFFNRFVLIAFLRVFIL